MYGTPSPAGDQAGIATQWSRRASEPATWARERLVVRDDAYGGHRADGGRTTVHHPATHERLVRHFQANQATDVVGLHVASPDEMCRTTWGDIDAHDGQGADPEANLRLARHFHDEASAAGLDVRLLDSNGKGGYHILIVHGMKIPLAVAYRLGKYLVRDHARFGFDRPPETFPKRPVLTGKRFGGWVRLPGRHHKRDHWTRVWSPSDQRWLEGDAAIDSLLRLRGRQVDPATIIPGDFDPKPRKPSGKPPRGRSPVQNPSPRAVVKAADGRTVKWATGALEHLGKDYYEDYDQWLAVGMALTSLGDDGLELWHTWSSQSDKYDADVLDEKWATFAVGDQVGDSKMLGIGSLFAWAKDAGWTPPGSGCGRRRGTVTIQASNVH
jgi:hypothetical protein